MNGTRKRVASPTPSETSNRNNNQRRRVLVDPQDVVEQIQTSVAAPQRRPRQQRRIAVDSDSDDSMNDSDFDLGMGGDDRSV